MTLYARAVAKIKNAVVDLICEPESFIPMFSSVVLVKAAQSLGGGGGRLFVLHLLTFVCDNSNYLMFPLHSWKKTKEFFMYSTKRPIFNIYYGLQLLLKKLDIQPYYNRMIDDSKQVGADLTKICKKSVENLKFVLNHEIINKFIKSDLDFKKIGSWIFYHNITNCSNSLNGETTLLLFYELEQKYEKRIFEKIVFGFLQRAICLDRNLFYLICDAFGNNYNVYQDDSWNLIIDSLKTDDLSLFTYLLSKSKQMNLDKITHVYGVFHLTLYDYARVFGYNLYRTMLFSHGATPFISCPESYFKCEKRKEDLLLGLLYCLHYRNVFVFL